MSPYKMVTAIANQKGGCAKTTTAVISVVPLQKESKMKIPPSKVLLIDLDPQGNCATWWKRKLKKTAYDLLVNEGENLPIMEEYLLTR